MTARAMQPRNTDPVAFLQVCNTRAKRDNDPRSLMSGRDRKIWLHRPIAVRRVRVGVADSTRDDFHQGLPWPRRGVQEALASREARGTFQQLLLS